MSTPLTFIVGCTGCGKGELARALALRMGAEIISLDSMKVYRRMDIGTAKPSVEIRHVIPHHLIDVVEHSEDFSVAQYVQRAELAIAEIKSRGRPVMFVGGTPLYLKALTEGLFEGPGADGAVRDRLQEEARATSTPALHERLRRVDPAAAERIHPNDLRRIVRALEVFELTGRTISSLQVQWDRERPRHDMVLIGLRRTREEESHRINERVRRMVEAGLVDEVRSLLAEPRPLSRTARQALGYAEMIEHLSGRMSLADAIEFIKINTRQLAKAQRTWLRRFRAIRWIDLPAEAATADIVPEVLAHLPVQP